MRRDRRGDFVTGEDTRCSVSSSFSPRSRRPFSCSFSRHAIPYMAYKQPCIKYQYVVTPTGPKILPLDQQSSKDEESPADYNVGGYLPVKIGDTFKHSRYRVVRKLGWGHFSTVWLVKDAHNQCHSALKVVKSAGRYAETARDEIKLLTHVSSFSPEHPGRPHIVSFFDSFSHQGPESSHVCIVFEPLGENLLALIERHKKKGVPKALVKVIVKQILLGLQYLHDECDLVHTDIKPENILISIPEIEAHIQNELSQSSSPTSRRVGIPLPTKTRGVSVPYNPQRIRRQVQIYNSQPLPSPGRSWGRSAHQVATSTGSRPNESGSGGKSVPGSYFAQMHISRLTGSTSFSHFHSGPGGSIMGPGSSIPKVSSGLSSYSTSEGEVVCKPQKKCSAESRPSQAHASGSKQSGPTSPSSSSSSMSSTMVTAGSSSMISTPPTSLSNSICNVVAGFMNLAKVATEVNSRIAGNPSDMDQLGERAGLPVRSVKGKEKEILEDGLQSDASSWKLSLSSSWKEKVSSSLTSWRSSASADTKPQLVAKTDQQTPSSSMSPSTYWKDPGAASLAPAVVVSAVAGADESIASQSSDFFPLPHVITPQSRTADSAVSEKHSISTTPAPPSLTPTGTPEIKKTIPEHPSLLTQTAPHPRERSKRRSSPKRISQLSAHKLSLHPSPSTNYEHSRPSTKRRTTKSRIVPRSSQPQYILNEIPPNDISDPPVIPFSAPPPTPAVSPTDSRLSHMYVNDVESSSSALLPEDIVPPIAVKIADLGNATPSNKHYTEDIQTRQYRAPEAILGRRDWDARVDVWSVACVTFELLTAEYLFDPQGQGELFTKDDDHMAQIIELVGDFPLEVKMGGKFSRELFDHSGALRYIRTLKPWPLKRVMMEKYSYSEKDSADFCSFVEPMLTADMRERKQARDVVVHPWLIPVEADGIVTEW